MPKVYLVNNNAPSAFATGRNPEHAPQQDYFVR
jgi:Zn-dependent protease with chaperone function